MEIGNSPKISIVTPSYNQYEYLEETICSVLDQEYSNIQYVVIDGNSTDQSVDIIRKYENDLAYWESEPDDGQYDAINRGFAKTDGEIMAWLNSDDKYTPWTLSVVAEIFATFPEIKWLTSGCPLHWDTQGRGVNCYQKSGFNQKSFFKGVNLPLGDWYSRGWIQQESTFWRRSLWNDAGGEIDSSLRMAGDFDLWARFFQYADLYVVSTPLGGFRRHDEQKTAKYMQLYLEEAKEVLNRYSGKTTGKIESSIRRFFYNILGHKAIPQDRLSLVSKELVDRIPLFYPIKQCLWSPRGWQIRDAYII